MKKKEKINTNKPLLFRSEEEKIIGGVAGGIARYFEVDANLVRFLFILITLLSGSGVLLYFILWIVLPSESSIYDTQNATLKKNIHEIREKAEEIVEEIKPHTGKTKFHEGPALILIVIGVLLLLNNFGFLWWLSLKKLWPVLLILLGFIVLTQHDKQ